MNNSIKEKKIPIVLANIEWMPPEKLLKEVQAERMVNALYEMVKPSQDGKEVGDAETLAYIMPQTQKVSLTSDWADIYLYLAGKVLKRWKQYDALPKEYKVENLSDYQQNKLKKLRRWIYKSRGGEYRNPVLSAFIKVFNPPSHLGGGERKAK